MPRSPAAHPNSVRDYHAGLAAARAGQPRDPSRSAWWLYGWSVADDAIQMDAMFDARAEAAK